MSKPTDSAIIEYNDDGSRTVTTVETIYPATKAQQATAWVGLGAVILAPLAPLAIVIGLEKWEERKADRKAAKKLKAVD